MQVALHYDGKRGFHHARVRGYLDEFTVFDAAAWAATERERAELVACIATLEVHSFMRCVA